MKKHFINIAWIIIVTPFYILLLICCVYSRCLPYLFIPNGTKVKPYVHNPDCKCKEDAE